MLLSAVLAAAGGASQASYTVCTLPALRGRAGGAAARAGGVDSLMVFERVPASELEQFAAERGEGAGTGPAEKFARFETARAALAAAEADAVLRALGPPAPAPAAASPSAPEAAAPGWARLASAANWDLRRGSPGPFRGLWATSDGGSGSSGEAAAARLVPCDFLAEAFPDDFD